MYEKIFLLLMVLPSGCSNTDLDSPTGSIVVQNALKSGKNPEKAGMPADYKPTKISFVDGLSSANVTEILYFDDSQPPKTPATTYTNKEEIDKIVTMLEGITIDQGLADDAVQTGTSGGFCGYEIHLKGGEVYTVWRTGKTLICDGK